MTRVIVNADDFGRSAAVNEAVRRAHEDGVLTSASLMVTGDAVDEAIAIAKRLPTLAVGLHLTLTETRPVLPPEELPYLVGASGLFDADPARAGVRFATSAAARRELAREVAAQFARFSDAGLALSHVDGHQHLHLHPALLDLVVGEARRHGAKGFRLPRDDRDLADSCGGSRVRRLDWLALSALCRFAGARLRRESFAVASRVYGFLRSGRMDEDTTVRVLASTRAPTVELYLHPSVSFGGDLLGPNPGDLAALLSPAVRRVIGERRLELATYPALASR